jgi:cytochrome c biogenesis protein
MIEEAGTPPVVPAAGAMDRVDDVLERLWHLLTSMRVAMIIMLLIAILGIVGSLVIQMPTGVGDDPAARIDWLNGVRPKFSLWAGQTDIMNSLQLFEVFNSFAFRILIALLTVSLVACSLHRIPGLIRTATKPRVDVGAPFFQHAPQHETIVARQTPADTRTIVAGVLKGRGYRTLVTEDDTIHVYGDRWRWMQFSGLIGHLSLVVIMAGAIIGGIAGYRDQDFTMAEGATRLVGTNEGLSVKLLDFTVAYDQETDMPSDYASSVILLKDGKEIDRHVVRVNDPLRYGDLTFYQASYGSAVDMTIKDAGGAVLTSEGVPFAWSLSEGDRSLGILAVPGTNYTLWILGTGGSGDTQVRPGQVEVQVFNSDAASMTPIDQKVLDQGKAVTVAGMTMTFDRDSQYTRLSVARDPGVLLVWLGSALLFVGFALRFMLPHKRVWGRITTRSNGAIVSMATLAQKDAAIGTDFEDLVNDIRTALQAPVQA